MPHLEQFSRRLPSDGFDLALRPAVPFLFTWNGYYRLSGALARLLELAHGSEKRFDDNGGQKIVNNEWALIKSMR